jgi:hypothetical protein
MNEIVKYDLLGEYSYEGVEGNQKGFIYLNQNNEFVGKLVDTNEDFLTCGNVKDEKLKLLKIPKNFEYCPVYWSLNKMDNSFQGNFYFATFDPRDTREMFGSLEKTLKSFKDEMTDPITQSLFDGMEGFEFLAKEYYEPAGQGTINLRKL